jgi:hypothetical protein
METRLARYRTMFSVMGPVTPVEIRRLESGFEIVMRTVQGESPTFAFQVANVEPFLLQGLRIERD